MSTLRRFIRGVWFDFRNRRYRALHEGCCMCGTPCDQHGYSDNHSPVDAWSYNRDQYVHAKDQSK